MRIITDIKEIIDENGKLIDKKIVDMDLSNLDLSEIDSKVWEGAKFADSKFDNTNIKFIPNKIIGEYRLSYSSHCIANCSFKNCDLSYLKDEDVAESSFINCDLTNTKLNINFRNNKVFSMIYNPYWDINFQQEDRRVELMGTKLPKEYQNKPYDYFDYADLDIDFLERNPKVKISSGKLYEIIIKKFNRVYISNSNTEEFKKTKEEFEKILELDKEGKLKKLYEQLQPYFDSIMDYVFFFKGIITGKKIDDLDLSFLDKKMLSIFRIEECQIGHLTISETYKTLNKEYFKMNERGFLRDSYVDKLTMPMTEHDWRNSSKSRLLSSHITVYTNLYIEFKRACNMHCEFCRNNGLSETEFDFDKVVKKTKEVITHIKSIIVGGGEPTIYFELLKKFFDNVRNLRRINFLIITNGSKSFEEYNYLINNYRINCYFSRHAVSDEENRKIFGDTKKEIMSVDELDKISHKEQHVLCCTCFKGGVDTTKKMEEYAKFAAYLGFGGVLFQNLHKDDEFNDSINIPDEVMLERLKEIEALHCYDISKPIYSNSDYVLYIAKNGDFKVSFKIYKKHNELLNKWLESEKRSFDLSLDPSGVLHETWRQQDDIIRSLKFNKNK